MIHDSAKDNETTSTGLRLGSIGWKHSGWADGFYPDDLPEDWQLGYYANEFSTLLIPAQDWMETPTDAEQLLEDVPDNFVFYLQCPAAAIASPALTEFAGQLGDRLAGVIVDAPVDVRPSALKIYQYGAAGDGARPIWTPENNAESDIGMVKLGQADIKTWRRWLEQFRECSGGNLSALFVSDDEPDAQQMRQLKTLLELMGF